MWKVASFFLLILKPNSPARVWLAAGEQTQKKQTVYDISSLLKMWGFSVNVE